jgi:hypothetical protein
MSSGGARDEPHDQSRFRATGLVAWPPVRPVPAGRLDRNENQIMNRLKSLGLGLLALLAVTALTAAPAFASGKPFVETKAASSIGETTATLNGMVNPNGASTKYHFEYGTTVSYGKNTAEVSVGSGMTNLEEAKAVTELAANTSYHFRIVATNANGTTDGSDEKFATPAPEPPGLPEFVLPKGETFPAKIEAPIVNRNVSFSDNTGTWLKCAKAGVKGEITSRKKVTVTDELTECSFNGESPCNSVGSPAGVVLVSGSGSLFYINKATKTVGAMEALSAALIECPRAGVEEKVRGNLLGAITPINTKTKTFELPYRRGKAPGEQEFTKYETEKNELLTATPELNFDGAGSKPMAFELSLLSLTASKALTISA